MNSEHYLVVGLGKTGHSIARYLQRKNLNFSVMDTRHASELAAEFQTEFPTVPLFLETYPEEKLAQISAVILSPGVPLETPSVVAAKALGIPVYGDIECLAREIHATPVIAITGTNGKSTVTTLVGLMAQASGLETAVAGNIGTPVLDLLADAHAYAVWVLELSSFQLEVTESLCPTAATILNVTPDHLDRHHSMDAYVAAKQRVYWHTKHAIYNRDDAVTRPSSAIQGEMHSFGLNTPQNDDWGVVTDQADVYLMHGRTRIMDVKNMRIKGRHNWENALAACALAHSIGVPYQVMSDVLMCFTGLPHRSQWVRTIDDVDWINDSKGTNVGATQSAIAGIGGGIQGKIVLIAGGQGKGADFKFLRESVTKHVRGLVLFGQDADKLETALADLVATKRVDTLEAAVQTARTMAISGDVVLLSPACASLDMFRDYNHRGDVFTTLVGTL